MQMEAALSEVKRLKTQASATKMVKEGHTWEHIEDFEVTEGVCTGWNAGPYYETTIERRTVREEIPPEYAPDVETILRARNRLQQIFESNDFYCARYGAGIGLAESMHAHLTTQERRLHGEQYKEEVKKAVEQMDIELQKCLVLLRAQVRGQIAGMLEAHGNVEHDLDDEVAAKAQLELRGFYRIARNKEVRQSIAATLGIDRAEFLADEMREHHLFDKCELQEVLSFERLPREIRLEAASRLGYGRLRCWKNMHPTLAKWSGISLFVR